MYPAHYDGVCTECRIVMKISLMFNVLMKWVCQLLTTYMSKIIDLSISYKMLPMSHHALFLSLTTVLASHFIMLTSINSLVFPLSLSLVSISQEFPVFKIKRLFPPTKIYSFFYSTKKKKKKISIEINLNKA